MDAFKKKNIIPVNKVKMKNLKTTIFNVTALGMLLFQNSYSQNNHTNMAINDGEKHSCKTACSHNIKTQTVHFKKGKVYEVAYADVKPEKMSQLNNRYFPKAMPFMVKYGAKMIGGFSVVKNESNMLPSNMVAIFEWPSAKARLKLLADKEFQKIVYLRDEAINTVNLGYFEVEENKTITFKSDKVYEFGSANIKPGKQAQIDLQQYFEISEPIKRSYGGAYPEFIMNFKKTDSKGQATFIPHMQFIVEWNSVADNQKLFANHDFKTKAIPVMMKAIAKFDAVFTKFAFPQ